MTASFFTHIIISLYLIHCLQISPVLFKILPRRELTMALVHKKMGNTIKLSNLKMNYNISYGHDTSEKMSTIRIPRGTLMNGMVTVNVNEKELIKPSEVSKSGPHQSSISSPEKSYYGKSCESLLYRNANANSLLCRRILNLPEILLSSIKDTVKMCDNLLDRMIISSKSYTKMKQEMITYFVPLTRREGTVIIIMMKVDPGVDMTTSVLKILLTTFGVKIMNNMRQLGIDVSDYVEL